VGQINHTSVTLPYLAEVKKSWLFCPPLAEVFFTSAGMKIAQMFQNRTRCPMIYETLLCSFSFSNFTALILPYNLEDVTARRPLFLFFLFFRSSSVYVTRWFTSKILPWGVSFEVYLPIRNCFVGLGLRGFVRFGLFKFPFIC